MPSPTSKAEFRLPTMTTRLPGKRRALVVDLDVVESELEAGNRRESTALSCRRRSTSAWQRYSPSPVTSTKAESSTRGRLPAAAEPDRDRTRARRTPAGRPPSPRASGRRRVRNHLLRRRGRLARARQQGGCSGRAPRTPVLPRGDRGPTGASRLMSRSKSGNLRNIPPGSSSAERTAWSMPRRPRQ